MVLQDHINKLNSLYLQYHSAYGHQTWQEGNLRKWAPAHKVTWLFDHGVLWNQVTTWNHYFSSTSVYGPQTCQAVDLPWGASSHVTPPFYHVFLEDMWKTKTNYLHYYNIYGPKTWEEGDLPRLPFIHKVKWSYGHLVL